VRPDGSSWHGTCYSRNVNGCRQNRSAPTVTVILLAASWLAAVNRLRTPLRLRLEPEPAPQSIPVPDSDAQSESRIRAAGNATNNTHHHPNDISCCTQSAELSIFRPLRSSSACSGSGQRSRALLDCGDADRLRRLWRPVSGAGGTNNHADGSGPWRPAAAKIMTPINLSSIAGAIDQLRIGATSSGAGGLPAVTSTRVILFAAEELSRGPEQWFNFMVPA